MLVGIGVSFFVRITLNYLCWILLNWQVYKVKVVVNNETRKKYKFYPSEIHLMVEKMANYRELRMVGPDDKKGI